jgi:Na+/H+ antiporter NhaD/arsenite permease-like protein
METAVVVVFALSYVGIAFGTVPPLALDRTGFALLGAIVMVAIGALSVGHAVHAIDTPTILLLYALMVVSAQLRLGGFYTWAALRLSRRLESPARFLLLLMLVAAGLAAVLTNDIICLAFTPVLCVALLRAGWNPVPFLLGLAMATNIGSAATIIGNPQNMLIGQVLRLDFARFLLYCLPPSLLALGAAFGILVLLYRRRWLLAPAAAGAGAAGAPPPAAPDHPTDWPELNRWQTTKGLLVVVALVALFFTRLPREYCAITAAGVLLLSRRMRSKWLLGFVDWHLLTLFCGLFIIIAALEQTGLPARAVQALGRQGLSLHDLYGLTGVSVVLSNVVSNVPATMLLLKFVDPTRPTEAYVLALSSTFAGNLITLGSIANLIVIEQARAFGVEIRFREYARAGVPVTLASLVLLALWILVRGVAP